MDSYQLAGGVKKTLRGWTWAIAILLRGKEIDGFISKEFYSSEADAVAAMNVEYENFEAALKEKGFSVEE